MQRGPAYAREGTRERDRHENEAAGLDAPIVALQRQPQDGGRTGEHHRLSERPVRPALGSRRDLVRWHGCHDTLARVIYALRRSYACRWRVPIVAHVDEAIFVQRYFVHCLQCTYCFDSCCQYGVDVDQENVVRLRRHGVDLERYTGVSPDRWFSGEWSDDPEFPGGRHTRTRVEEGACVFRSRAARGCMIHSFALDRGLDYHDLKPMVSVLFPVTFDQGLLHPATEIKDGTLQCAGDGPTLYRGIRSEIPWYFGHDLVAELDAIEAAVLAEAGQAE
jgi:hypothetical protein